MIKNEYIKIGYLKLFISFIIFILLTIFLFKYNDHLIEYIYIIITFVGLDLCILFSGIISNEYDSGTFRFYLTKPIKRYKIYTCKYLSMLIYLIILLVCISITYFILLKNFNINDLILIFKNSIPLVLLISIIMLLSTIFKNSSLSTSFSLSIFLLSNLISQIFFGFGFTYIEYTFLPYLDYSILENVSVMNEELNIHLSLNRGMIIDSIYLVLLFILGLILFKKKDIKN